MKSVDHFFDKLKTTPKHLALKGAVAMQAFLSLSADAPALDKKEALSLRKITEYWREGNFQNAKSQILTYIHTYPDSPYLSEIYTMLGDLYFQDKAYQEAVEAYSKITSASCKEFTLLRCMESLFLLGQYKDVYALSQQYPLKDSNKEKRERFSLLRAESLYRIAIQTEQEAEQKRIAHLALESYKQVKEDANHQVTLAIAHLHALVGEGDRASQLYLELTEVLPEKVEELTFRAASQIALVRPDLAKDLFRKVITLQGEYKASAVFNRLTLLYKEKDYAHFNEEYEQYSSCLLPDQLSSLLFCRCISLFQQNRFEDCVGPLQNLLQKDDLTVLERRQALLSLFFCAQKLDNLDLVQNSLPLWTSQLPVDTGYLRGLFVKAQLALNKKDAVIAKTTLQEILSQFPTCEERESILFDYAQSLVLNKEWIEARSTFQQFLTEFAHSSSAPLAWEHFIYCSMQMLNACETAEKDALKGCLIHDLQAAINVTPPLAPEVIRTYQLGLAQLYFELGQHREALMQAQEFCEKYASDPDAQSMRLLATACHVMLHSPPETLILFAEDALAHEQSTEVQMRLHLQLYNAYLTLADQKSNALEKASDHLLQVYESKKTAVKKENLLWLADYLSQKPDDKFKVIAIGILEETLPFDGSQLVQTEVFDSSLTENYALRLSSLYEQQNMLEKAHAVLSSLIQLEDERPNDFWQQRRQVLFSLGQIKEKLKKTDEALGLYTRLIDEATYASASYYRRAALLKRSQLQFASLPIEEKKSESEAILGILDTLKELQITKNIHSEPIHLEAALDYIAIRSALTKGKEQTEKSLFYLEKMKEDFTDRGDQLGLHYHQQRAQAPDQDSIYSAYMHYVDTEIKRLKAVEQMQTGNQIAGARLEEEAKQDFLALLQVPIVEKTPLIERIQFSLEQIRSP